MKTYYHLSRLSDDSYPHHLAWTAARIGEAWLTVAFSQLEPLIGCATTHCCPTPKILSGIIHGPPNGCQDHCTFPSE